MHHPLMPDLSILTDTELHEKINKILDRMSFFSRIGHTHSYQQANNIYQMVLLEQQERAAKNYIKNEDQFGDLINIRKI